MKSIFCLLVGYFMGAFNPAQALSRQKNIDLRQEGTGNLGASNALLVLGKKYGAVVMVIDIFKAWLASRMMRRLFPELGVGGLLGGFGAVLGHVFPFHLGFRGGKGLASFAGMVLAQDPAIFLILLIVGVGLMLLINYSFVLPITTALLLPGTMLLKTGSLSIFAVCLASSILIIAKHWRNIGRALRGDEARIRDIICFTVFAKNN